MIYFGNLISNFYSRIRVKVIIIQFAKGKETQILMALSSLGIFDTFFLFFTKGHMLRTLGLQHVFFDRSFHGICMALLIHGHINTIQGAKARTQQKCWHVWKYRDASASPGSSNSSPASDSKQQFQAFLAHRNSRPPPDHILHLFQPDQSRNHPYPLHRGKVRLERAPQLTALLLRRNRHHRKLRPDPLPDHEVPRPFRSYHWRCADSLWSDHCSD